MRALDYLLSRPEVDKTKVGITGNSGGGTHTSYIASLEDRLHVAAPSCYLTSWRRLLETIGPQDPEQCFPGGRAAGYRLISIENITGSSKADPLTGNDQNNVFKGGAGNDTMSGGKGNDELSGGIGADRLDGGDGTDWLNYLSEATGVTVDLRTGAVSGAAAFDVISDFENVAGTQKDDTLKGNDVANVTGEVPLISICAICVA